MGLVVLEACLRENPEKFAWRTETYEFVDDPIAIDLLFGSTEGRGGLETKVPPRELLDRWSSEQKEFIEQRQQCLLY